MANPRSAYFSWRRSRPAYCGVKPHLLAVFTINKTFPLYWARSTSWPLSDFHGKSQKPPASGPAESRLGRWRISGISQKRSGQRRQ